MKKPPLQIFAIGGFLLFEPQLWTKKRNPHVFTLLHRDKDILMMKNGVSLTRLFTRLHDMTELIPKE